MVSHLIFELPDVNDKNQKATLSPMAMANTGSSQGSMAVNWPEQ